MGSKDEMNFKGKIKGDFNVDKSIEGSKIEKSSSHEELLNVEQDIEGSVDINKSIKNSEVRSKWGWIVLAIIGASGAAFAVYMQNR